MQVLASLCWFPGASLSILCCSWIPEWFRWQPFRGLPQQPSYLWSRKLSWQWQRGSSLALFMCKNVVSYPFSSCYWTGNVNDWDLPLSFMCNANYVMAGVGSFHDNGREDRLWRFKCCHASGYQTKNCRLTGHINNWDAHMNYRSSSVFAGLTSYHDNGREWVITRMHLVKSRCMKCVWLVTLLFTEIVCGRFWSVTTRNERAS